MENILKWLREIFENEPSFSKENRLVKIRNFKGSERLNVERIFQLQVF